MGKLYKLMVGAAACGLIAGGCMIGKYVERDPEYSIQRKGGQAYVYVTHTKRSYELNTVAEEAYLGTSDHNMHGVQAIARIEGIRKSQPQIKSLQEQNDELTSRITKRQLTDELENLCDDVKDGWRNFKHNIIGEN